MFCVYEYNIIREKISNIITYNNDCYIKYIIYICCMNILEYLYQLCIRILSMYCCVARKCNRLRFCCKNQRTKCCDDLVEYYIPIISV